MDPGSQADSLLSDAAGRPWQKLKQVDLGLAKSVPSMLNDEEIRFYHWISKRTASAAGSIVDLGAFIGGATAHLAEGTRAGGATDKRIFAFDHFSATEKVKRKQLYPKGIARFDGEDIFPISKRLLIPWQPNIVFRRGRIEDSPWRDGPISLLVLDASKTTIVTDHIARTFFPHLIPGQSVIIQQDELHWKEPWIAVQMQRLARCFVPICHIPGNAVAYICARRPGPLALRRARVDDLSDEALIDDLQASSERLAAFDVAAKIDRQIAGIRLNPGQRRAWAFKNRPGPLAPRKSS